MPADFLRTNKTTLDVPLAGQLDQLHGQLVRLSREVLRVGRMPLLQARLPRVSLELPALAANPPAAELPVADTTAVATPEQTVQPTGVHAAVAGPTVQTSIARAPDGAGEAVPEPVVQTAEAASTREPTVARGAEPVQDPPRGGDEGIVEPTTLAADMDDDAAQPASEATRAAVQGRRLPPRGEGGRFVARRRG